MTDLGKYMNVHIRFLCVASLTVLILALQSCGSSNTDSTSTPNDDMPFTDPVDASTLRSALLTGTSATDDDEFWLCTTSAGDQTLEYRLYADGAGTATDLASPGEIFAFTWETTSATSLTSTDASGQGSFSDIQFSGPDTMSLVLSESLLISCNRQSPELTNPDVPSEDVPSEVASNSLSYGGVVSPLTHGFEERFRFRPTVTTDSTEVLDTHSSGQFQVADAVFSETQINLAFGGTLTVFRPNDATVWLRADLYSPGGDGFTSATFTYRSDSLPENSPDVANTFFFNDGRFGVDIDGNGDIDSDANEFLDVTGGTITVTRMADTRAAMSFDVLLSNGVTLTGSFEGVFPVDDNN